MNGEAPAYGLWTLALINSVVFIFFAYSFFKPATTRDWRSFGAFSAFIMALFAEMYGFPLTIYFLSGWLQSRFPNVDWFSHDAGHLLEMMFGWKTNPHFGLFHILSYVLIGLGFVLIASAWRVLFEAQRSRALATSEPYSVVRHPQYVGFILVMLGFLVQWPTILTLAMFPVLTFMYVKLARNEERESLATFGDAYRRYMAEVPGFIPARNASPGLKARFAVFPEWWRRTGTASTLLRRYRLSERRFEGSKKKYFVITSAIVSSMQSLRATRRIGDAKSRSLWWW